MICVLSSMALCVAGLQIPARSAPFAAMSRSIRTNAYMSENQPPPEKPVSSVPSGRELQIDDDRRGIGLTVLFATALAVPLIAFQVASVLGMGAGSIGNDGLGVPLSIEEAGALERRINVQTSAAEEEERVARGLTAEEAREEEALVRILRSEPLRAW